MDCLVSREGKHSPTRPPVITSLWWQQTVLDLLHPNYIPHSVYSKPTRSQGCVRTSFNHNSQQIQTILQSKFHQWRGSLSTVMSRQPALAPARFEIHSLSATTCFSAIFETNPPLLPSLIATLNQPPAWIKVEECCKRQYNFSKGSKLNRINKSYNKNGCLTHNRHTV